MDLRIMQGDSYGIPITIEFDGGIGTPDNLLDVEVVLGDIKKSYSEGKLTFDDENNQYIFPLTQTDSLAMAASYNRAQIRIKLMTGEVIGQVIENLVVDRSLSKVVL